MLRYNVDEVSCYLDYSAGKRDRGKNFSVPLARAQQKPPCQGQGRAEGPDTGPIAEEGPKAPDDSAEQAPSSEKVFDSPALLYMIT